MDQNTVYIVGAALVAIVILALGMAGKQTKAGSTASQVMGCLALALVVGFFVLIWLIVKAPT